MLYTDLCVSRKEAQMKNLQRKKKKKYWEEEEEEEEDFIYRLLTYWVAAVIPQIVLFFRICLINKAKDRVCVWYRFNSIKSMRSNSVLTFFMQVNIAFISFEIMEDPFIAEHGSIFIA